MVNLLRPTFEILQSRTASALLLFEPHHVFSNLGHGTKTHGQALLLNGMLSQQPPRHCALRATRCTFVGRLFSHIGSFSHCRAVSERCHARCTRRHCGHRNKYLIAVIPTKSTNSPPHHLSITQPPHFQHVPTTHCLISRTSTTKCFVQRTRSLLLDDATQRLQGTVVPRAEDASEATRLLSNIDPDLPRCYRALLSKGPGHTPLHDLPHFHGRRASTATRS